MLNEKAHAAIALARAADQDERHDAECRVHPDDPDGPCQECARVTEEFEAALARWRGIEGEPEMARERLRHRSNGYTQKLLIAGHTLYVRTGEYDDGRLGGIRLDIHKQGSAFRGLMSCFADAVSLGLQHGVPLNLFVRRFAHTTFEPNGICIGRDGIKKVSSFMDAIFKDLALSYGVEIPPEPGEFDTL